MRSSFDTYMDSLNTELIKMGALCEEALSCAIKTLFDKDEEVVRKAEVLEEEIDTKERDIEALCTKILIREHPVAGDLRIVSAAMKMIADMERIGDMAKDIAELSKNISENSVVSKVHIENMTTQTKQMLYESINAFVRRDVKLAAKIEKADDGVDECFDVVKDELTELLKKGGASSALCLDILMVAKYLERIGDHAVNIAEWVIYAINGEKKY